MQNAIDRYRGAQSNYWASHRDRKPKESKQDIKVLIVCATEQAFQAGSLSLGDLQSETEFEAQ